LGLEWVNIVYPAVILSKQGMRNSLQAPKKGMMILEGFLVILSVEFRLGTGSICF
jgi:hypothetical protein